MLFRTRGRAMSLFSRSLIAFLCLPLGAARADQPSDEARAAIIRRLDELVAARIKAAGLEPAAKAGDEEFVRRVYLDLTGAVPRVNDVRAFLADERPDK